MRNETLIFRSLAVLIFIAGTAHLVSHKTQKTNSSYDYKESTNHNQKQYLSAETASKETIKSNSETNYILGKWKVTYDNEDFKGSIIYEIKREGAFFYAYTYQYQDGNGYAEKAQKIKTLTIKSFDGQNGDGTYLMEYEGQQYHVDCQIDKIDQDTFKLSYDYYSYSDIETWKRQ